MKSPKSVSPKKRLAANAINQAMDLAGSNSSKLKSVKIKIKFGDKGSKPAKRRSRSARGGY